MRCDRGTSSLFHRPPLRQRRQPLIQPGDLRLRGGEPSPALLDDLGRSPVDERGVGQLAFGRLARPRPRPRGLSPAAAARPRRRCPTEVSSSTIIPSAWTEAFGVKATPSPGCGQPQQGPDRPLVRAPARVAPMPSNTAGTGWLGRRPWSERNRRTAVTSRISDSISASAAGSAAGSRAAASCPR